MSPRPIPESVRKELEAACDQYARERDEAERLAEEFDKVEADKTTGRKHLGQRHRKFTEARDEAKRLHAEGRVSTAELEAFEEQIETLKNRILSIDELEAEATREYYGLPDDVDVHKWSGLPDDKEALEGVRKYRRGQTVAGYGTKTGFASIDRQLGETLLAILFDAGIIRPGTDRDGIRWAADYAAKCAKKYEFDLNVDSLSTWASELRKAHANKS